MNNLSLENKILIMQAIIKTNEDFVKTDCHQKEISIEDKTKQLLGKLELVGKRLDNIECLEDKHIAS